MCVRISLVYFSLLAISLFVDSKAEFSGYVSLSCFLLTYVTTLSWEDSTISVES